MYGLYRSIYSYLSLVTAWEAVRIQPGESCIADLDAFDGDVLRWCRRCAGYVEQNLGPCRHPLLSRWLCAVECKVEMPLPPVVVPFAFRVELFQYVLDIPLLPMVCSLSTLVARPWCEQCRGIFNNPLVDGPDVTTPCTGRGDSRQTHDHVTHAALLSASPVTAIERRG